MQSRGVNCSIRNTYSCSCHHILKFLDTLQGQTHVEYIAVVNPEDDQVMEDCDNLYFLLPPNYLDVSSLEQAALTLHSLFKR